ncbi:P-loop containing nucleoside triphosphate hydrolase protein [Chaetomium fimeti]|uniref:P-loop containing nucleoside triphosphate hydrolase protein n=1 Tax=Chaetomium fimeti TaxID=1854472 RepID=A0AAE0LSQ4_9PEZI|nr:P-loop containing nucleoside triphosphate hydrolase protein [Chaetomium fimeti]
MLLIGLTGSIATGKSTVSSLLSQPPYSLPIIDADLLAREVVEPGTAGYKAIVAHFGPSTPDLLIPATTNNGNDAADDNNNTKNHMPEHGPRGLGRPLNRAALGRRVFGDDPARRADRAVLNGIVHPAVRRAMLRAVLKCYVRGCRAVVLDVPLLFESRLDRFCGAVMVVAVRDPEVQMARLRARDPHLSREDAENRVRSQGDVREKARRCEGRGGGSGVVVWNDGGREELKGEVARVMAEMERYSPRWWNWLLWVCPPVAVVLAAWGFWRNVRINRAWEEQELRERSKL